MDFAERIMEEMRLSQVREGEKDHERALALIRAQSHALVWRGTEEELSGAIIRWFELGLLEAESRNEALRKAAIHFVRPDGSPAISPLRPAPAVATPEGLSNDEAPLPGATIHGAGIDDWIAWNGESYVIRQTRESIEADKGLRLIGSARALSSGPKRYGPGLVNVVLTQSQEPGIADAVLPEVIPSAKRRAAIQPLLDAKGWSILDWANAARVSHATAQDYLSGKTNPYPSTRLKLAKAFGIMVQQLPR